MAESTWPACLHESAHVVAARELLHAINIRAFVVGPSSGITCYRRPAHVDVFAAAVATAAGHAAERLADVHEPPAITRAPTPPAAAVALLQRPVDVGSADIDSCDSITILRWCEAAPSDCWEGRWRLLHATADEFVTEHSVEILEHAGTLYREGAVALDDAEADGGIEYVDK